MSVLTRAIVILGGDSKPLDKELAKASAKLRSTGERMQEVGTQLSARVTLPLAGIAAASTFTAAKFDESMRSMAALVGVPAAQLEKWKGEIPDIATEFGRTAQEAADAMFFITSSGIEAADAMGVLKASLTGAAIGLGDARTVADAATSAMNAYASTGLTAERATEVLAAAVKFGKLEAEQLAPTMGRLTGTAAALGIAFEDVAGVMSVFSLTGTQASEAATQVSAIMSLLLGTSKEGEEALAGVGLKLEDLRDIASGPEGIIGVMRTLDQAMGGNVEALRTIIPNVRAFRGVMNALAQDADAVNVVMDGVRDSQGLLDEAMEASRGPMLRLRQAWSRISTSLILVGDAVIPVVVPAITGLTTAIRVAAGAFDALPTGVKTVVVVFGALAAAAGPVLITLGAIVKLMPIFAAAMSTGLVTPIGLGVAALGALVAAGIAVVNNWAFVRSQLVAAWATIKAAFFDGIDALLAFGEKIPFIGDEIAELREGFNRFADESLAKSGRKLFELDQEMGFFTQTAGQASAALEELSQTMQETAASTPLPDDVIEAMAEYREELAQINRQAAVLGANFDQHGAKGDALARVIETLTATGIGMNVVLDAQGTTLMSLGGEYDRYIETQRRVAQVLEAVEERTRRLNAAQERATQITEMTKTPQEVFNNQRAELNSLMDEGLITQETYNRALGIFTEQLKNTENSTDQLKQGFVDLTTRGIDAFVDSVFDASTSFSDFVKKAIIDIGKLMLKIQLLRLIAPEGSLFGIDIPGFAKGGFLPPGQVGLVGERGPELVRAGRAGLRIAPMSVGSAGGSDGGANVTVVNHITAMDARSVGQFFEENEGLVANSMMKAMQRSSALQKRMR